MNESNITGYIDSIETMGLVDGPGVRVVVFMQGCPLRCIFCHNPEMWNIDKKNKVTPQELVDVLKRYKNYFGETGGVTFSGGEPLIQNEFILETLKLCKQNDIHTCLDTSGACDGCEEILKYTDLVIWDIKAISAKEYENITNYKIDKSLKFLNTCQKLNKKMWLRQVIIPNINDNEEYINELRQFISPLKNIEKVELLPYHTKAINKYKKLNISYKLENTKDMDVQKCKYLEQKLKEDLWKKN